jgi:molybdenum cofactor cytidylyltransferase
MSNQVAGIILAAGGSSRFGSPKQLLPWRGTSVLNSVVSTAFDTGLAPVIVVIGANADQIEPSLPKECVVVRNDAWPEGQSSSIRIGLAQLSEKIDGVLVLLGDQPQVNPHFCSSIIQKGLECGKITIPYVNDRRANPVFFPKHTLKRLGQVTGDQGGRAIFSEFQVEYLPWLDDCMALDIDTPEDYEKLKACYNLQ